MVVCRLTKAIQSQHWDPQLDTSNGPFGTPIPSGLLRLWVGNCRLWTIRLNVRFRASNPTMRRTATGRVLPMAAVVPA